jgi:hypothetical protein
MDGTKPWMALSNRLKDLDLASEAAGSIYYFSTGKYQTKKIF